jgi:type II secretory pathway component GspD/PulD (secretin)
MPEIGFTQLPILDLTSMSTQVSVPDGGALLIGGLKRKGESKREVGVPLLDKIPYLKRFFTNKSFISDKQVLVVLLRPRIIDLKEEQGLNYPVIGEQ